MAGPLEHIRVLDLSRVLAGPWTGQILADLGADVIKVERPGEGDDTRRWGPPFLKDKEGRDTRESGYYLCANRGKRSIAIDLNTTEGQTLVKDLAARADVVLENFKVGTLAGFGLGYEDLKAINPRLIYCSITGFGQDGPRREQLAYDFMIQAMGGLMSVTGERDDRPGGGPQKVGVPIVDLMTGLYAGVAVLAGLARRTETGKGDYIDLSMLDVMVGSLANQAMNYLLSGRVPRRAGNEHPNIQPQDVFACRDGHIVVVVGNDAQFAKFCNVIGRPEWVQDERFVTNPHRVQNVRVLLNLVQEVLVQKDMKEWAALLDAAGVPCSPILPIPDVLQDPQVQHRQMAQPIEYPHVGKVTQVVSPLRFQAAPLDCSRPAPGLGQHTQEILRELGCTEAKIAALHAARVIG